MILEQETLLRFGYSAESLNKWSKKQIILSCDYCQTEIVSTMKRVFASTKILNKHACKACMYQKQSESNLTKYGVTNPRKLKSVIDKANKTVKERYGVENVSQVKEFKDKRRKTCLDRFGNELFMSSEIGRDKLNQGIKDKHGVEFIAHIPGIQDKTKATNLEKYGFEYVTQSPIVQAKTMQTNLDRYGYTNPSYSPEIKSKIRQSMVKSGKMKDFDGRSMRELADEKSIPYSTFALNVREKGIDFALSLEPHENGLEKSMSIILDEIGCQYTQGGTINKRRYDFLLSNNILLEADGIFYHSDYYLKDNDYHKIKRKVYVDAGYKPFFIRENEVNDKPLIVKSIIANALGLSTRIFARKCKFQKISKEAGNLFFSENHLMGKGSGEIYALLYQNEVMCAMRIKRIKDKNYEISRFCSKLGYSIIGGFSSLLLKFEQEVQPQSLKTYIDLRYGSGSYLPNFGFEKISEFLSFKWTTGRKVYNRMQFPGNTGYESNLNKLWDCGQAKYVKTYR